MSSGGQTTSGISSGGSLSHPTSASALGVTASSLTTTSSNSTTTPMGIHVSGQGYHKPTSTGQEASILSGSSSHHGSVSGAAGGHVHGLHQNNRSGNNSTLLHHNEVSSDDSVGVEQHPVVDGSGQVNEITSIDEINLGGSNVASKQMNQNHVHFYSQQQQQQHQQPYSVHYLHQLPPISNTLKVKYILFYFIS